MKKLIELRYDFKALQTIYKRSKFGKFIATYYDLDLNMKIGVLEFYSYNYNTNKKDITGYILSYDSNEIYRIYFNNPNKVFLYNPARNHYIDDFLETYQSIYEKLTGVTYYPSTTGPYSVLINGELIKFTNENNTSIFTDIYETRQTLLSNRFSFKGT